jgi:hypothetical protein
MQSDFYRIRHVVQEVEEEKAGSLALNELLCLIQLGVSDKNKTNIDFGPPEPNFEALAQVELQADERDPGAIQFLNENVCMLYNQQNVISKNLLTM